MYYCEYAHLLKKHTEHTCMLAIYYDQSSNIKANKCKTMVTFDTLPESKILDASDILILSNLQKPWTIVCKDVNRTLELEYSTYRILNRYELCECSLTAGNYLHSQSSSNCESWLLHNILCLQPDSIRCVNREVQYQVDEDTITQLILLHSDIPGYDLPAIDFMSPSEEAQESHILKEQDAKIFTHLEKVLAHMIDEQAAQIFKSHNDYVQNKKKLLQYLKYAETWQYHQLFACMQLFSVTFFL